MVTTATIMASRPFFASSWIYPSLVGTRRFWKSVLVFSLFTVCSNQLVLNILVIYTSTSTIQ